MQGMTDERTPGNSYIRNPITCWRFLDESYKVEMGSGEEGQDILHATAWLVQQSTRTDEIA